MIPLGMTLALATTLCFDFTGAPFSKLAEPLPPKGSGPVSAHGKKAPGDLSWGAARATISTPVDHIYRWLLDHRNWKDPKKTEMKVIEPVRPGYDAFHQVEVDVRVFAFITVSWTEEWAYRIVSGAQEKPTHVQIAYQKTAGSGKIRSLCGFIDAKSVAPGETDLSFYEQADASHYSAEAIENMHLENLRKLAATGER